MNDVYTAIMKAADHIEKYPKDFVFLESQVPWGNNFSRESVTCGTPGCALGWIGAYLNEGKVTRKLYNFAQVPFFLGLAMVTGEAVCQFYSRMDELVDHDGWRQRASLCAHGLRLYAAKYHAPKVEATVPLPASVQAIFVEKETVHECV